MYIAPATITANITISGISEEKLSQNSWKLITDSGLLLCKLELADETDKCRYCAAEDNRVECYPFAYSSGSDDFNYNEFVIIRQTMQLDALNIISSCRALALTLLLADGQFQRRYNSVVCSKMEPTTGFRQ